MKTMIAALCAVVLSATSIHAQTARQTVEKNSQSLSTVEKVQVISDILRATMESGSSNSLNATCILAMDSSVKTTISPLGKIRKFFGAIADPAFNSCVEQFCALGEGHTSFAQWVYYEQCSANN